MGKAVAKYADLAIVTDDNPRDLRTVFSIFRDIVAGLKENYEIIQNREDAIFHALNQAGAADTVAILGKGAEKISGNQREKISVNRHNTRHAYSRADFRKGEIRIYNSFAVAFAYGVTGFLDDSIKIRYKKESGAQTISENYPPAFHCADCGVCGI